MQYRTSGLTLCAVLAAIAGAASIGFMAGQINGIDEKSTLGFCCTYLVVAVLFFALAGGFKENGQWSAQMMSFMCFVIIAIVLFAAITEIFTILSAVILIVLAVIVELGILLSLRSENWFGA